MTKSITLNVSVIVAVLVGVIIGVGGSVAGLLVSPRLAGVSSEFRCVECHQLHGAITLDNVPFNAFVLLTGDVPEPRLIGVNEMLPYRLAGQASISLLQLLAQNGVEDFKEVSLISTDGGIVTLERQYVSDRSLLLAYVESVRFKDDGLHVSTWLKGINKIVVVGNDLPIIVDGRATSMGRLLRENTLTVISERSYPMYHSEEDGQIREGEYSHLHTGAPLEDLVAHADFATLTVTDAQDQAYTIDARTAEGAILTIYYGEPTLMFPDLHKGEWVADVVKIVSNP
jgi:hypothetical protein